MPKSRSSSSVGTPAQTTKLCEECGSTITTRHHNCGGAESPESVDSDHQGERRRSERVKREKPDYYDALEFENKRKTRVKGPKGSPNKRHRATLTWKKGDEDDDERDKRKRKRSRQREADIADELPPEKTLQCRVGLAEINRKLAVVMNQPA